MDRVRLGKEGPLVAPVGVGMWQGGGKAWGADVTDAKCIAAMVRAQELGMNLIDTAEAYGDGHSEEVVGKALKKMDREDAVVATKVIGGHLRYDDVIRACEGSLKRLGLRTVDLYQIHWPDPWDQVPLKHTMRAMEKLQRDGKIRYVGVSNFAVRDLEEAREHLSRSDVVSNQVQYSLVHRAVEEEVLPYCEREGIGVIPWSPLAKGLVTGKYSPGNLPKDPVRQEMGNFSEHNVKEAEKLVKILRAVGGKHSKTPAQVALQWLVGQGTIPIPGVKNPKQVEENAGALGWSLTEAEEAQIRKAAEAMKIDFF